MKTFALFFFVLSFQMAFGQETTNYEKAFEKKYQERIRKPYLHGTYIPKDIADVFNSLNLLIDKKSRAKFKNIDEGIAVRKLFFSLGRWMIHNWEFYDGSRLSHYLHKFELYHPDDMARFIIIEYHRYLRKEPLKAKEVIALVKSIRAAKEKKRSKN